MRGNDTSQGNSITQPNVTATSSEKSMTQNTAACASHIQRGRPSTRGRGRRAGCNNGGSRTVLPKSDTRLLVKLPAIERVREKGKARLPPHHRGRSLTCSPERISPSIEQLDRNVSKSEGNISQVQGNESSNSSLYSRSLSSSSSSSCVGTNASISAKPTTFIRPPLLSYRSPPKARKKSNRDTSDDEWVPVACPTVATKRSMPQRVTRNSRLSYKAPSSDSSPSPPRPPRPQRFKRCVNTSRGRVIGTIRWPPL